MTIAELTEKILKEGYRITRENLDKELLLTADLEEMLDCAGKLQKLCRQTAEAFLREPGRLLLHHQRAERTLQ